MNPYIRIVCILLYGVAPIAAQTYTLQSNQVKATIHVNGSVFTDGQNGGFKPVQPGLPELSLLNGSGLWMAGTDPDGNLRGAIDRISSTDFQPGALSSNGIDPGGNLVQIWPVTCTDVEAHIADYNNDQVVNNPQSRIFGFASKGNSFFDQYNPAEAELPFTQQALAGFYDLNDNAQYNPDQGEYPALEIRGCPLVFPVQEMAWSVVQDGRDTQHPSGMMPLKMEVQRQVFELASQENDIRNTTVFVKYKLINRGETILDSFYVGIYSDLTIGNAGDDYIGVDPDRQVVFGYNGDNQDEGGFENNIPVVGVTLLRGPIGLVDDEYISLKLSSALSIPDPSALSAAQLYHLLQGRLVDGAPAPNGGFMFPGNPAQATETQTEVALGNTPGKRRSLMSVGPLELFPGAVNEVIVAYSYRFTAGGFTPAEQLLGILEWSEAMRDLFQDCFDDGQNVCSQLTDVPQEPAHAGLLLYPNPAQDQVTVESKGAAFNRLTITDALGRLVQDIQLTAPALKHQLRTGHLAAGVYWIRVDGRSIPLVIQH